MNLARARNRLGLLLLLLTAAALRIEAAPAPARILFIGNSYTGVNHLPKIFTEIVTSTGAASMQPSTRWGNGTSVGMVISKTMRRTTSKNLRSQR